MTDKEDGEGEGDNETVGSMAKDDEGVMKDGDEDPELVVAIFPKIFSL